MNIIDSLVITLGLDSSALKQGAKEATAATAKLSKDMADAADKGEKAQTSALGQIIKGWNNFVVAHRKAVDESTRNSKAIVAGTESIVQSGERAIRTFGALFLLFAGANSLKSFITDMVGADAALGRTAKSIGQTPEALSGIGRAVERMGGTFSGAVGGLRGLSDAFEQMRTTGNTAIMEPLARLQGLSGRSIKFGKDVRENFYSIADALHAMKDQTMADFLGRQILGDEGLTNLAKGGSAAVKAAEAQSPKITREQTEAAQKLQAQLEAVRQGFEQIGNAIVMDFGPAMVNAAKYVKGLIDQYGPLLELKIKEWVGDVGKWFTEHKADIENFGNAIGGLVTAVGTLATAFVSQSPMMQGLEAFALLMGGRVLGVIGAVNAAMTALSAVPVPAWALRFLGLPAAALVATTSPANKDEPTMNPDGSMNYTIDGKPASRQDYLRAHGRGDLAGDAPPAPDNRNWWQKVMPKWLGGANASDTRVKDDIADTAKATKETRDILKAQADTGSGGGVAGGGGANLGDRLAHGAHHLGGGGSGGGTWKGNYGQKGWWTDERQSHAVDYLMKNAGLTEDGAKALVARWRYVESPGGPTAVNPTSGAEGIAQWLGSRKGGGSAGSFDEQLGKVAKELGGSESRAKRLLNTPGQEANGASAYERAEGWNAGTNTDNFTGRVREGMRHIAHGGKPTADTPAPTAAAPSPAGTSERAITEQEAFAAHERLVKGGRNPKDRALYDRWLQQQNTSKAAAPVTLHHAIHHVLKALAHARALTHHNDNHPVPVTLRDHNGQRVHTAEAHARMVRLAGGHHSTHHNISNSSDTRIAAIHIHTRATDARGIAADIEPHLNRVQAAGRADYGLA